jgi:DNA repair exonuclease SbcCD ATPase subunit
LATRTEMLSHVDGLYVVSSRLETEYYALMAAVKRLEKQMEEQIADRAEVRSELLDLKDQVSQLNDRIAGRDTN